MIEYIPKGWGNERIICNNDKYCGKILTIYKDHRASFHYHIQKYESFYIQSGKILLLYSMSDVVDLNSKHDALITALDNAYCHRYNLNDHRFLNLVCLDPTVNYAILSKSDVFDVPPLLVHQMIALEDSEIIEFSTHSDDSDSYRIIIGN